MKFSLRTHKIISLVGFVLLLTVLFFLTYNTFKLRDEQYQTAEKALINEWYTQRIRNDKVFPGGIAIIDHYLMSNIRRLETLHQRDTAAFKRQKDQLLDSMFHDLRLANPMDSLFAQLKAEHGLHRDLQYLLTINTIQLVFSNLKVVKIYQADPWGAYIGGALKKPRPQNRITNLTVSAPLDYNYWITFSLHADHNRTWNIFKLMMPTFLLALFAIGCVVSIYYITFRNWLRQKKLAEMKSDFVNSITHEFNTPLSTIIVANKNMQHDAILANPANIGPLSQIIERQALRLQKLFDQVIDITTMEDSSLQKEPNDLYALVHDIITDYNLNLSGQDVVIELHADKSPTTIEVNKFFFTTMIVNLFDNAIKHNTNAQKRIAVAVDTSGPTIDLSITDNGKGIPEAETAHIFEKFYRGQRSGGQHVSGLGLGLYYTYQCIKIHGWTISVSSEEHVGSRFTIRIPQKS
ncbi:sensor histidine kinase [Parapedobacter sp. DT-150]|uniref:sensor histidine kinase n=1 Tax=Parapedobacter sp. DT-150 TaxID=3396162 RepID=UPI003F1D684D